MATTIRIHMHDDLLTLTQWFSPSFPIGAFAYSHGLEQAISDEKLTSAEQLFLWLSDVCQHGAGHSDIVLLASAYRENPEHTDMYARAFSPSAERLKETDLQGAAFVDTVNSVWSLDLPRLSYPVAVGAAAAARELPLEQTAQLYLHSMLANLTSAAVRLVPLGQTDGQRVLADCAPLITATTQCAIAQGLDDLSSICFAGDIAAMRHETLDTRIFRT